MDVTEQTARLPTALAEACVASTVSIGAAMSAAMRTRELNRNGYRNEN